MITKLKGGDEVLIQQQKTLVKSPWDPEGFEGKEVKGSKLILQQREETRIRAKHHVKFVGKRPKELEIEPKKDDLTAQKKEKPNKKSDVSEAGKKPDRKKSPELDLEVSWATIQAVTAYTHPPSTDRREAEEDEEEAQEGECRV